MNQSTIRWTRREALSLGALAAGALSLSATTSCSRPVTRPKNILFLVSDGMSGGVPALAEAYSQLHLGKETFWHQLSTDPGTTHGLFDMASMDSLVTDSAAAASAWGCGQRVPNRVLNQYPDGTSLKALGPILKENGYAVGLVTTSRMTHATPAGFCATAPHRDFEDEIAPQFLDQIDVLMGGGDLHFVADYRTDGRDLEGDYIRAGYERIRTRDSLLSSTGKQKILGLFYPDHLPYSIDRNESPREQAEIPTLAEMTKKALEALKLSGKGFFLMVEAARVDHAAHSNDAAGIIHEQLAFDEMIGVALEFQKSNPDTLIVISSDHGNANPGLNGIGPSYTESTGFFRRLARIKISATKLKQQLEEMVRNNKQINVSDVAQTIQKGTGFAIDKDEALLLLNLLSGKGTTEISSQQKNFYAHLGQILGNWHGVGWTGVTHTSDWTLSLSRGPGQETFSGLMKNTDFFNKVLNLYSIDFSNPAFTGKVGETVPEERGLADPTG